MCIARKRTRWSLSSSLYYYFIYNISRTMRGVQTGGAGHSKFWCGFNHVENVVEYTFACDGLFEQLWLGLTYYAIQPQAIWPEVWDNCFSGLTVCWQ
jgi:hypothetical protein